MSYILDALKKSEIERRAGSVCGLIPGATYVVGSDAGSGHAGVAIVAAVGMLGAGLALGIWHPWQAPAAAEPIRAAALPPLMPSAPPADVLPPPPAMAKTERPPRSLAAVRSGAAVAVRATRPAALAESGKRVVAYGDLPAEVRGKLPKITFGGYAGTDEAEARIAFINNRLIKEGEEVSPGLKLVEVGQTGVVLGFQGYRFRPTP